MGKKKKGQFALYIGFEGNLADANTNEIIQRIMANGISSVSMVFVVKEYRGEEISVLEVTRDLVERFYAKQHNFKLRFVVYAEINYILQEFRLLEQVVKNKAKQVWYFNSQMRKRERRDGKTC